MIMNVITIPKKLVKKDDMVIIPRKEYELLLQRQPKVIPVVKLTTAEKRAIARSEKEFSRGEYITLEELEHELGGTDTKKALRKRSSGLLVMIRSILLRYCMIFVPIRGAETLGK